jgi:phosphoribosylamine--glycine ligase
VRVLVIGSGGREHALLLALANDPSVTALICAPGNAGTAQIARNVPVDVADASAITALAQEQQADLVVIGPEVPLVNGAADALRAAGIACFGPSAAAAQIEGSKAFAKDVMAAAGVRTARAEIVENPAALEGALGRFGPTWVVKDDGLAAGKGVVVTADKEAARAHALDVMSAGHPVLLESFLDGPEVSLFSIVDGETVVPLLPAQDHKRVGDGDTGPNTGGMGAYCPLPWLPDAVAQQIVDEVVRPVAAEMARRGTPFSGLLYAGLAIGKDGPAVVEFNCRFGDPETQAVLALLESPLGELLAAAANGTLAAAPAPRWRPGAAVTVVLAARGYPGTPHTGDEIEGSHAEGVLHAGTKLVTGENGAEHTVSAGGRVLSVVGVGNDLTAARDQAYARLSGVKLDGGHYRHDIALPAVEGRISL